MTNESRSLERVAIVGTSCTGKTTLARTLSDRFGVPHVELDALHWGPHWTPVPSEVFRARVRDAIAEPRWIVDGTYWAVRDLVWTRATTLIWLDYPFRLVFPRAIRRTFRRIVTQEVLFAGNRESLAVTDPDWIPWWVLRTFRRRRRELPALLREPHFAHLRVLEFRRPAETDRFLREVGSPLA